MKCLNALLYLLLPNFSTACAYSGARRNTNAGPKDFISPGLIKGTLIALADGNTKPIEHIRYDDMLSVWNFDAGTLDQSLPLWIQKPTAVTTNVTFITFSDGINLTVVGDTRFFCKEKGAFVQVTSMDNSSISSTRTTVDYNNNDITLKQQRTGRVVEEVAYYSLITARHFNLYANGILISTRLSDLHYPIVNMVFDKSHAPTVTLKETYPSLAGAIFDALRLSEHKGNATETAVFVEMLGKIQLPRPRKITDSSRPYLPRGHPETCPDGTGTCSLPS